ncbi:MAG: hypothetical protein AAGA56_20690 [Myxococcota bacterium]
MANGGKFKAIEGPPVDLDALLVALVLVPHSYPRNRFFRWFQHPEAARVRRRAAHLRSVVTDLTTEVTEVTVAHRADGVCLRYRLVAFGATRTVEISADELALVAVALDTVVPAPIQLQVDEAHKATVTTKLNRLLDLPIAAEE